MDLADGVSAIRGQGQWNPSRPKGTELNIQVWEY